MMRSAEIIRRLEHEGWRLARSKGSHHHFVRAGRRVTVPHPARDLPIGTLRNIYRQAGWKWPPDGKDL
jgi:predicted RNA binding protein YcfA (HicA-like mRNA interferase family)